MNLKALAAAALAAATLFTGGVANAGTEMVEVNIDNRMDCWTAFMPSRSQFMQVLEQKGLHVVSYSTYVQPQRGLTSPTTFYCQRASVLVSD